MVHQVVEDMGGNLNALKEFYLKCCNTVRGHASPRVLTPEQLDLLDWPSLRKLVHDAIRHDMRMQARVKWNEKNCK